MIAGLLAVGWGVGMLVLQHRLLEMQANGRQLPGIGDFLADGSSRSTAWIGWAAAFFFLLSLLRVVRGRPEPPAGGERSSVAAMRAALRREYRLVRVGLGVIDVLAMFDAGRAVAYAIASGTGDDVARANLVIVGIEAGGLVCAAAALTGWMVAFRRQLGTLGAL